MGYTQTKCRYPSSTLKILADPNGPWLLIHSQLGFSVWSRFWWFLFGLKKIQFWNIIPQNLGLSWPEFEHANIFFFIFSILADFADQIGLHVLETTWARLVILVGLIFYDPPWSALLLPVPIWLGLLANSDFDEDFKFFTRLRNRFYVGT